jgi:hypothetical protein
MCSFHRHNGKRVVEDAKVALYPIVPLMGEDIMRLILAATATALAIGVVTSTAALAQSKNNAAARASLNDSFNRCVELAKARGYSSSDLDGNRAAARNFVIRCMQGKQR